MSNPLVSACANCGVQTEGGNFCPMCGAPQQATPALKRNQWHRIIEGGFRRDFKYTYIVLLIGITGAMLSNFVYTNGLGGEAEPIELANNLTYIGLFALVFSFIMNFRAFLALGVAFCAVSGVLFGIYGSKVMMFASTEGVLVDYLIYFSMIAMVIVYIWEARRLGLNPVVFRKNERQLAIRFRNKGMKWGNNV